MLKTLHHWSTNHIDNFNTKIKTLWAELNEAQINNDHVASAALSQKLDEALIQEEGYWQQRARTD